MSNSDAERTRLSHKGVITTIAIIAEVLLVGIVFLQPLRYSDDGGNGYNKIATAFAQGPQGGNYTFGILASIQNNENGDPFWIVSGNWRTNLLDSAN